MNNGTNQPEVNLLLSQPLAQALVSYLETKPFREVHQLIGAIMCCPPAPVLVQDDSKTRPDGAPKTGTTVVTQGAMVPPADGTSKATAAPAEPTAA